MGAEDRKLYQVIFSHSLRTQMLLCAYDRQRTNSKKHNVNLVGDESDEDGEEIADVQTNSGLHKFRMFTANNTIM